MVEEIEEPNHLFYYHYDENGQPTQIAGWIPEHYQYFQDMIAFIETLRETVNKNWKPEEYQAYQLFLNDLSSYIMTYVFGGAVHDFNVFLKAMNDYGEKTNPLGYELYNIQCDYLAKKESGYNFNLEKKKKKKEQQPKQEQKAKPREQKKEEEVVVRKDDPTITA